jgi:hypothetical protein
MVAVLFAAFSCDSGQGSVEECTPATPFFGSPTEATGLGPDTCGPSCGCRDQVFAPPAYTDADADALLTWTHLEPYPALLADPYTAPPELNNDEDAVCAVEVEADGYRLRTYASLDAATAAGVAPTHFGGCGVCSTLADLAVYMRTPDLTEPVRDCGLQNLGGSRDEHVACLQALGFTTACADIWYYNTLHTGDVCGAVCFAKLDAPYNLPTGELNACLQCDEDQSGPVFAAVAGRTRRNTGLPSSICRPCAEVQPVFHDYGPPR